MSHAAMARGYLTLSRSVLRADRMTGFSGMPTLEPKANGRYRGNGGYADYRATTSPLVPMPPSWYAAMPVER